jgi:hypothetical protein
VGGKDEQNGYVEHEPRWLSNAGSLVSFSHSSYMAPRRKGNNEDHGVWDDFDLRIKFSGAPPWLCADAEAIGPSKSRADVGCCKKITNPRLGRDNTRKRKDWVMGVAADLFVPS